MAVGRVNVGAGLGKRWDSGTAIITTDISQIPTILKVGKLNFIPKMVTYFTDEILLDQVENEWDLATSYFGKFYGFNYLDINVGFYNSKTVIEQTWQTLTNNNLTEDSNVIVFAGNGFNIKFGKTRESKDFNVKWIAYE